MEKKNVVFLTVLAIATLLTAVVGTTFAYFTATVQGNEGAQTTTVTTAQDLGVTYSDGNQIGITNALPGAYSNVKEITVRNDGNIPLTYQIQWDQVSNNFRTGANNTDDLVYSLIKVGTTSTDFVSSDKYASTDAYSSADLGDMISGKAYSAANSSATIDGGNTTFKVGKVPSASDTVLLEDTVGVGETNTYRLVVYFLETGINQNANQSSSSDTVTFSAKLKTVIVNNARVTYTP